METKNRGLIFDKPSLEHWIFGQSPIAYEELQPDGNWENFLPTKELQSREGLESYACVVYTILNCCEILLQKHLSNGKFTEADIERYLSKNLLKKR